MSSAEKCVAKRKAEKVAFGEYGLQAVESHWITNRQIEAARIAMTRYMKRGGKVWIKIFPHKSYTAKAIGVRMGSGKGLLKDGYHQLNVVKSCLKLPVYLKKLYLKITRKREEMGGESNEG